MAARVVDKLPEGDDWIYEVKFPYERAGYRARDHAAEVNASRLRKRPVRGEFQICAHSLPLSRSW
jgi:hypothetical protein